MNRIVMGRLDIVQVAKVTTLDQHVIIVKMDFTDRIAPLAVLQIDVLITNVTGTRGIVYHVNMDFMDHFVNLLVP